MILIINVCKEKLHYFEFVKPIEDILKSNKTKFVTKHYKEVVIGDLEKTDKVIICGTSLADNEFMKDTEKFYWIQEFSKPILGICAGMQIIGINFGAKLKKKTEIGFYPESLNDSFLGLEKEPDEGSYQVYHLHNYYADFDGISEFKIFMRGSDVQKIPQAVKHREKEIYGVLFHPEVRQKEMILKFAKIE